VSVDDALREVAEGAHAAIPGVSSAAITIVEKERFRTAAMAGDPAQALDDAQYSSGDGPCLTAIRENHRVEVPDIAESEWLEFRIAAASNGFRSSLSLPLSAGDTQIGALNLYSRRLDPLTEPEAQAADTLATAGGAAAANLLALRRLQEMVVQLGEALESRDVIGQAKGIVMAHRKISATAAFELLVTASQHRNMKVREIAIEITETGSLDSLG